MLINLGELAFLRKGLPQVKVGVFGFDVTLKSPDLQNLIEAPKCVYLLNTEGNAEIELILKFSGQAVISSKFKLSFPLHIQLSNNVYLITLHKQYLKSCIE